MADKYCVYEDDNGDKYGILIDDAQLAMTTIYTFSTPDAWSSLALLITANAGAVALPLDLHLRKITITHPFFGPADLMIVNLTHWADVMYRLGGDIPGPNVSETSNVNITGYAGESRP
jgi:hypothetical protein